MCVGYTFVRAEIVAEFSDKKEMNKKISAFNKAVKRFNERAQFDGSCGIHAEAISYDNDAKNIAYVTVDSRECSDVDNLAKYVCKYFPTANGSILWSTAEENGMCCMQYTNGGRITIKDGAIEPDKQSLKKDVKTLVNFLADMAGNYDAVDLPDFPSKIKKLIKKYNGGK